MEHIEFYKKAMCPGFYDSSAIYKAISSAQAGILIGQGTSPLAAFELGNIIIKYSILHKVYSNKEAKELLSICEIVLEKMKIINPDLQDTYQIAARFHLSFYDAAYASLALRHKITLVTLDKKLANKISGHIAVEQI